MGYLKGHGLGFGLAVQEGKRRGPCSDFGPISLKGRKEEETGKDAGTFGPRNGRIVSRGPKYSVATLVNGFETQPHPFQQSKGRVSARATGVYIPISFFHPGYPGVALLLPRQGGLMPPLKMCKRNASASV